MAKPLQDWRKSRRIVERIIVEGDLILSTPAHFGSGDEGDADLGLLRDALDGSALLPGASIAGALRNYLRERKWGYGAAARNSDLFGGKRGAKDEEEGDQSLLIVEDAVSRDPMQIELRDGVGIDAETRTSAQGKLFDMEVLRAGDRGLDVPLDAAGRADLARIDAIWSDCLARGGNTGPWLFGRHYCIADAMYAPVVLRFNTYGATLSPPARAYFERAMTDPHLLEWIEGARREIAEEGRPAGHP